MTRNTRAVGPIVACLCCACDAGRLPKAAPPPPKPEEKPVEVAPPPADAAMPAAPTPAVAGLRLDARVLPARAEGDCERETLRLRLVDKKRTIVDQYEETSECDGACSDAAKQKVFEQLAANDALIAA